MNNLKRYTIEIDGVLAEERTAKTPKDAILSSVNNIGWNRTKNNIIALDDKNINNYKQDEVIAIARTCLLGGTKESVNYYAIV